MITHRTLRFRAYPTAEQEEKIARWEPALRFLWNLAHEQRRMGLDRPSDERRYPTAYDQGKELTLLRSELPWLAALPRSICVKLLIDLDAAWQRCFKKSAGMPHWKRKTDRVGIAVGDPCKFKVLGNHIQLPKLGKLRAVIHRPLLGKQRTVALKRDGDQWFVFVVYEIEVSDPPPRIAPVLGIDRGITNLLADSDGNLTPNPKYHQKALGRLARAQRAVSRKKKGSKNQAKAKVRVMRIHRKVRRQREHFLHVHSARIAKSHGVVVIEKLNTAGMLRGRPLARSIADAGWSTFARMLRYKLSRSGGTLVEVLAHYSSQTCSVCSERNADSRRADRFSCVACGHSDHADLNAAKILKARASRSGLPMEGSVLEAARRSGKEKGSCDHFSGYTGLHFSA